MYTKRSPIKDFGRLLLIKVNPISYTAGITTKKKPQKSWKAGDFVLLY